MSKQKPGKTGLLIIFSAPSGCGKTTIVDRLLKRHPDWIRSVSVTTRSPRIGEKGGGDYYFVLPSAFQKMEENGELLESAKVFDHFYGTPKSFVLDHLKAGKNVVLTIDVQGMRKIKSSLGSEIQAATIFVLPPSLKVLRERLEGRKTESPEDIERRISVAQDEIKAASFYDFTVMNQSIEQTVSEIESFIEKKEHERGDQKHALRAP